MRCVRSVVLLLLWVSMPRQAHADVRRFAVAIGVNVGDGSEVELRYAESDAQRIARTLQDLGGFHPEDVLVLTDVDTEAVRRTLQGINVRIREHAGDSLLFVFYSGHADAESLHIRGGRLSMQEMRDLIYGSAATARVLVVDACRSGTVTRIKGGRPAPPFAIDFDEKLAAKGVAILTSSAAGEDSQESDAIGASFFTHYLASGLIGAADGNRDGKVSLGEAFAYAAERTTVATSATVAGPQHPTYRFDLGGREDLVITHPGFQQARFGLLELSEPGVYLVQKGGPEGAVVGEVASSKEGARVALPPGTYFVTRRGSDHLLQGRYQLQGGRVTAAHASDMQRIAYARVVRKGGTLETMSVSAFVMGNARGVVGEDGGHAMRWDIGSRLDFASFSTELRLGVAMPFVTPQRAGAIRREITASLAGQRAFDLGPFTLGAGLEVGVSYFQRLPAPRRLGEQESTPYALVVGPLGAVELPLGSRAYLRGDAAALVYGRWQRTPTGALRMNGLVTYRLGLGFGVYF